LKGDWVFITLIILIVTLFPVALGFDWVLGTLHIISRWLMALPAPTDGWAKLIGAIAWPSAILLIAWWLFEPLELAARKLAARFETDDLELGKLLKVTSRPVTTYSPDAVTQQPDTPEAADVNHAEALLEYAAESSEHVENVLEWIHDHAGAAVDVEAFFYDDAFAPQRKAAYIALVEGPKNG